MKEIKYPKGVTCTLAMNEPELNVFQFERKYGISWLCFTDGGLNEFFKIWNEEKHLLFLINYGSILDETIQKCIDLNNKYEILRCESEKQKTKSI